MGTAALPVAMGLGAISTGFQSYGAYQNAKAQNQANEYNARVMEQNAALSDKQAQQEIESGKQQEDELRKRLSVLQGNQRATFGATGVRVDEGSALDMLMDTAKQGELDAINLRYNAGQNAYARQVEAYNHRNQAQLVRLGNTSPLFAGASTLLSGASNLGWRYYGAAPKSSTPKSNNSGGASAGSGTSSSAASIGSNAYPKPGALNFQPYF